MRLLGNYKKKYTKLRFFTENKKLFLKKIFFFTKFQIKFTIIRPRKKNWMDLSIESSFIMIDFQTSTSFTGIKKNNNNNNKKKTMQVVDLK